MARRMRPSDVEKILETLRLDGFEAAPCGELLGRIVVSKYGVRATLDLTGEEIRFLEFPALRMDEESAVLVDCGFQKFFRASWGELPATAERLSALHRFEEELKFLAGLESLYHESLGATSDLHGYDRRTRRVGAQG